MNHTIRLVTLSLILASSTVYATTQNFAPVQSPQEIQQVVNFLTHEVTFRGDGEFMTIKGRLPRSYFSDQNYWGHYICETYAVSHGQSCEVTDVPRMENGNFVLNGQSGSGAMLQVERIDASRGSDIYDAATWQIAIALAAQHGNLSAHYAQQLSDNVNQRLARKDVRATGDGFQYGYQTKITDPNSAYGFRMLGQHYLSEDPLVNSQYDYFINFDGKQSDYAKLYGKISWADWKPITGENAWAFFTGPLQADEIFAKQNKQNYISFKAASIQHAIKVLPAVISMQSPIGGIYYAPGGSDGNEGPITKGEISIENNLSLYAGIHILQQVLQQTLPHTSASDQSKIKSALATIDIILNGGEYSDGKKTEGMLSFLKNYAWDASQQEFIPSGHYDRGQWEADTGLRAVDVNTWGIAILSPDTIDTWFGSGSALTAWKHVKSWGGYCLSGKCKTTVEGVGFSDKDGHQVFSGEWTFGAINAVRELVNYYSSTTFLTQKELQTLKADERNMTKQVLNLRTDNYSSETVAGGIDKKYQVKLAGKHLAYLYANKRYHIPFGWYANPIPSTASSSWAVMMYYNFNPFRLGG